MGNEHTATITVEQDGREHTFDICNDAGYISNMASSYGGMVYSGSLWGGGGIDMNWLDGMTGCDGECNIDGSSVKFSNFKLLDDAPKTTTTTTTTQKTTTTKTTTTKKPDVTTTTTSGDHSCPGGSLADCINLCPNDPSDMYQDCVNECI